MDHIREGNFPLQKFQNTGSKFINSTEIPAQEASYNILGTHMSEMSRTEINIYTNIPEKRVRIIKSRNQLENMLKFSQKNTWIRIAKGQTLWKMCDW